MEKINSDSGVRKISTPSPVQNFSKFKFRTPLTIFQATVVGKPEKTFFELALQTFDKPVEMSNVVMIGKFISFLFLEKNHSTIINVHNFENSVNKTEE